MKEPIRIAAEINYQVEFVADYIKALHEFVSSNQVAVVVPSSLRHFANDLPKHWMVCEVPDGENQKDGQVLLSLLNKLADSGFTRDCWIVGLGGGATTDLAGFVAATYLRGVKWIAVPTSMAAMVDAAIGGKTGINLKAGKNLAGSFYSPRAVFVDINFLNSLSDRDLVAGMAEVVKCGFISDTKILDLCSRDWRANLPELIHRAVAVKARVVSSDFKESFEREILNYGHTLGHAIEKHCDYKLRHGECVAIGMVFAAELSSEVCDLDSATVAKHREILKGLDLPTTYSKDAWPELFQLMQSDKKRNANGLRFVTLRQSGLTDRADSIDANLLEHVYLEKIGE